MEENRTAGLQCELERLEAELDYQVSNKRIAAIQQRISEIEELIKAGNEKNTNQCRVKE